MRNNKKVNKLKKIFTKKDSIPNTSFNQNHSINDLLNYYSSLAIYHPDLIVIFSRDADIVTLDSKKASSLFGITINHKNKLKDFLSEQNYDLLSSIFLKTLNGKSEKCSIEVKNKKDKSMFLALTFIPIINKEEVEGVYLIVTNITDKVRLKQQLTLNEKHLNYAQQIATVGSWEYQINEDKLFCSENFYNIFGLEPDNYISMENPFKLVHPHDKEDAYEKVRDAMIYGKNYTNQFRIVHGKTLELMYIKVQAEVFYEDRKPSKIIGVIKDVTYETQLENQLVDQNENYRNIYNNLSSGIWMRETIGGKFLFVSKGLEKILDIPVSELYINPKSWYDMIHPNSIPKIERCMKKLEVGEGFKTIYQFQSNNGKIKWLLEEVVPKIDEHGQVTNIFGLVTDVTNEMEIKEKLIYLANFDDLTGLPYQKSLFQQMDLICKDDTPFAIFSLDLDRFNIINDSLGYSIGDEALKFIANRFVELTPKDGYLARLSSNDFIMIYKNFHDKEDVYNLARTIIKRISEPFIIQDYELYVSTSIGITFFPEEGREKHILLENAHTALYQAKREGKNKYQLSSHLADISSYKKYVLDRDMRKAISNQEFELYFQPQVDSKQEFICGAEALIRWNHKEWGMISPGEFIPLAEENHMINPITDWVIQKVCSHLYEWKAKGLPIKPIAINIPPARFLKTDLLQFVKEQIEQYQIDPSFLEFEITESTILNNEIGIYSIIQSLKELGIRFAVDDYGTGYASLASIRQFKPDTLKIDKLFIQNITHENGVDRGIISATLHLSKLLDMKVVAEGVEEFDQLSFLKQLECDVIQGYLFSKPVQINEFEKLLTIGYLKPKKTNRKPLINERRRFFRFEFSVPLLGQMTIGEVNGNKVQLGNTPIIIDNISLGGLKIHSNLKLPINTNMKFHIRFTLLYEEFELSGDLKWVNEEDNGLFSYGVATTLNRLAEDRLASVINKLSTLRRNNEKIPGTEFVYEDVQTYFRKE
ncbi:EAL domain-containing protein [Solibacillus sp. FSL W8-0474]|uniref:bifunctional diguanylate cyclase/phosphodiesterase n=1 Tax=Solibacillus sp. FSL W8-0474 TaxID=2975336 RepID=UPI0030F772DE